MLFLRGGVVGEVRFIFGALSERININVYKYYTYKNAAAVPSRLLVDLHFVSSASAAVLASRSHANERCFQTLRQMLMANGFLLAKRI